MNTVYSCSATADIMNSANLTSPATVSCPEKSGTSSVVPFSFFTVVVFRVSPSEKLMLTVQGGPASPIK
jgi:hypothetical protein